MEKQADSDNAINAQEKPAKEAVWAGGIARFRPLLRTCKECGVPLSISRNHIWEEHGRIMSRDKAQRLVIVESKIIDGILARVSEKVDSDAEKAFIYAKAFDASHYTRSLMVGWKRIAAAYPLSRKSFYQLMCAHARILGMGDARLLHYERDKDASVSFTRCYNRTFLAGDILGAAYTGENREAAIEMSEKGGETVYTLTFQGNEGFKALDRYSFSWEVPLPGYINFKRCKRCDIPFSISFFSWDFARGLMVDTHNGEPVSLINVAGINIVHEEMKAKHGDWVDDFLATEIKEMVDGILPGLEWKRRRPEERIRDLFFLAYRGMGNPIFTEPLDDGIRVRIENPFNYPIVAGVVASFLSRGREVVFDWEKTMPGRMEVNLHFR